MEVPKPDPVPRLNMCYLMTFALVCALSAMQTGSAMIDSTPLLVIVKAQEDAWPKEEFEMKTEQLFLNSPLSGVASGSLAAGYLMRYGRRLPIIAFLIVGIIGSILSVLPHLKILCLGRYLYGFAAGVTIVLAPKALIETIPARIYDHGFGASTNSAIQILIVISTFLISYMPDKTSS